ncbi:MAG: ATP-binding protein [Actinomycetota bacterium]
MATRLELQTDRFFTLSLDMLCTAGFDGYFCALNLAWARTLGWSIDKLQAAPFMEFVHPDDRAATLRETMRLQSGMDSVSFENRYRHRDGSYRWLQWNATASMDERLYYAVARDVTAYHDVEEELRVARDEADRANLAKSEFLSRMSHELRTPLTSVLGFSQLLEMETLSPSDQKEAIRQIRKGGQLLLDLINEVLDIARVESGRMPLSMEPVLVSSVIAEAKDLVRPLADKRHIGMRTEGAAQAFGFHVHADRQRLKQVLLNLLANAVKYCGGGCTITVVVQERENGVLRIGVRDTGPGIAPGLQDRVFTPFDRLGAKEGGEEGTGMGLALSKRLIEAMGGRIGLESEVAMGSTFWVDLPVTEAPIARFERESDGALPVAGGAAGERASTAVLIEDNLSNVKFIEYVLRKRPGSKLIPAMQGSLGIELALRHHPDLILLDLNLPDLDGREVLAQLKNSPETAGIPVVILSADAAPQRRQELLDAGADRYLSKPLDVAGFLEAFDGLLAAKEDAS